MLEKVFDSFRKGIDFCTQSNGSHFKNICHWNCHFIFFLIRFNKHMEMSLIVFYLYAIKNARIPLVNAILVFSFSALQNYLLSVSFNNFPWGTLYNPFSGLMVSGTPVTPESFFSHKPRQSPKNWPPRKITPILKDPRKMTVDENDTSDKMHFFELSHYSVMYRKITHKWPV